jgi:hypothetical protein
LTEEELLKIQGCLGRLMLAWDGQWFLKAAEECGLDKAVEINARVRVSFGRIEMREVLRALGKEKAESMEEAIRIIELYGRAFMGDGLLAEWEQKDGGVNLKVTRCSPQAGAARAGLKPDTPCIACAELWHVWFSSLLPDTSWTAEIRESLGRGAPACRIRIRKS